MSEIIPIIRPEKTSLDMKPQDKRSERPEMEVVAKEPGRIRKPSLAKKAASTFLAEDIDNVKQFIIYDVLIPGIKEAFLSSLEMLLWGSTRRGGYRRNVGRTNERVSYDTYYDSSRSDRRDRGRYSDRSVKSNIDDIELDFEDAEDVVQAIQERIIRYGDASLQDLFRACRMKYDHVDQNWGWERGQEGEFHTKPLRNGLYTIVTPKLRLLQ